MTRIRTEMSSRLPRGVTLKRAVSANYIDPAGVQQTAGVDIPRFDVHPISLRGLGLLIEDQDNVTFDDPGLFNGEHTFEVEFYIPSNRLTDSVVFDFSDATGDNRAVLLYRSDLIWHFHVYNGGVRVANVESAPQADIVGWHRAAVLVSPNNFKFYLDGAFVGDDTNGPVPGEYTIGCLGQAYTSDSRLVGTIMRMEIGPALEPAALLRFVSDLPPAEPGQVGGVLADWDVSAMAAGATSQIDDQSVAARHLTQATAINQPVVVTSAQNGLSAARFDGVNDWMAADSLGDLLDGTDTPWSIAIVCRLNVLTGISGDTWWSLGHSAQQNQRMRTTIREPNDEDSVRFQIRDDVGATQNIDDGAETLDTNFHLYIFIYDGTAYTQYKDGVKVVDAVSADHGQQTYDQFTVGAYRRGSPQSWANYDLGQMRVYDHELTTSEINTLGLELNGKWAIY